MSASYAPMERNQSRLTAKSPPAIIGVLKIHSELSEFSNEIILTQTAAVVHHARRNSPWGASENADSTRKLKRTIAEAIVRQCFDSTDRGIITCASVIKLTSTPVSHDAGVIEGGPVDAVDDGAHNCRGILQDRIGCVVKKNWSNAEDGC